MLTRNTAKACHPATATYGGASLGVTLTVDTLTFSPLYIVNTHYIDIVVTCE